MGRTARTPNFWWIRCNNKSPLVKSNHPGHRARMNSKKTQVHSQDFLKIRTKTNNPFINTENEVKFNTN
jgi:hypothetical protein